MTPHPAPACAAAAHNTQRAYRKLGCRCPDIVNRMRKHWRNNTTRETARAQARTYIKHPQRHDYDPIAVDVAITRARRGDPPPLLTPAERRAVVADLTRRGWSANQIADALHVSMRSVQRHRSTHRSTQEAAA